MKLDSKYFDSIRVASRRERDPRERGNRHRLPDCQWKGCNNKAEHRAPKGRGRDGEYFQFCMDHVRRYNATYNYFDGMSDSEVAEFIKDAVTGHRPTWRVGGNGDAPGIGPRGGGEKAEGPVVGDPHDLMSEKSRTARPAPKQYRRTLKPLEKKSLAALDLGVEADKVAIKAKFKALVKLHHPDANGGDRRSEEKLREIIQAYNYLKQAGLV
ncbi:MAG: DnaJ domain-containing protein [Hyphomicrobiaceae bacterium]|nr:DnaJ domain-containing protein [Hyphomicrobiaceae bacterium]